jgi:hypothetical protein
VKNLFFSVGAVIALTSSPYSCHKPTAEEQHRQQKRCFGALDANLKFVAPRVFERAGLDASAIEFAAREEMNAAYDSGERLGFSPHQIYHELVTASSQYVSSHTWQSARNGRTMFRALGTEVNDCLLDFYGRPND